MSLKKLAHAVRAHGRGEDTVLIHMTPKEVSGLQRLAMAHGGSLTINPHTGLPEAGFLSAILPMVLGAGLAATGIGAPLAAGLVGGGTGLLTGDWKKGLAAGLGAFGGAGIGAGLMNAGAAPLTEAATAGAADAATAGTAQAASTATANTLAGSGAVSPGLASNAAANQAMAIPDSSVFYASNVGTPAAAPLPQMAPTPTFGENIAAMGRGVGNTFTQPQGLDGLAASMQQANGTMFAPGTYAKMTAAPLAYEALNPESKAPQQRTDPGYIRPYTYHSGYRDQSGGTGTSERKWYDDYFEAGTPYRAAEGGAIPGAFAAGGGMRDGGFVIPADVVSALGNGSSAAGLELLSRHMGAQPIEGPGDGMSDSIPTHINGRQQARVARDEAYISPERVAQMGGAKALYDTMARIRKQAHGKTSQQRQIDPRRVLT